MAHRRRLHLKTNFKKWNKAEHRDFPKTDPTTESVETYPAGRGHILRIVHKRTTPKRKHFKENPRFNHCHVPSNPESIDLVEYLNSDGTNEETIKRIILFPENRQLNRQERLDLACALLVSTITYNVVSKRYTDKCAPHFAKYPHFLTREIRLMLKKKWKRYEKWRRKNS